MSERERFEQWCPIKIVNAAKAPKSEALKSAYWTAWQAAIQAERERCAKIADERALNASDRRYNQLAWDAVKCECERIADAIRRGGEHDPNE